MSDAPRVTPETSAAVGVPALDRFDLFAGLWGFVQLMHAFSYGQSREGPLGPLLLAGAGALVIWPRSTVLLAATMAVDALFIVQGLPQTANHVYFELLLCCAWVATLAAWAWRRWRAGVAATRWLARDGEHPLDASVGAVRWALLGVYWLSVLHKLNVDFIDPDVSCAGFMYRRVRGELGFLPEARWAEHLVIWVTLATELALPVLLLRRGAFRWGLVLAIAFHLTLSLDPAQGIYSFTSFVLALIVVIAPREFVVAVSEELASLAARLPRRAPLVVKLIAFAVGIAIVVVGRRHDEHWTLRTGFWYFGAWAVAVSALYLRALWRLGRLESEGPGEDSSRRRQPRRTPPWLWALPGVVLLSGLSPYLGLRTQLSFSMFSNLRTEAGRSNHLFLPRLASLGHFQDDRVEILDADDDELLALKNDHLWIPYFELRRALAGSSERHVTYRRNGETLHFDCHAGRCNDEALAAPMSRVVKRLLHFRPVDSGPRMRCRH